jgi:hypothetical protein
MSRCLSDKSLMRVLADLGTEADLTHLDSCPACVARRRAISGEMDRIRQVLLTTPEPLQRSAPRPRRSIIAVAGLATAAVGALLWIEVTVWRTIQPSPDSTGVEQVEATLADVTASLFSVSGEPTPAFAESPVAIRLAQESETGAGCDEPRWLDEAECSDTLSDFEEPQDSIEMGTAERTVWDTDSMDQGG